MEKDNIILINDLVLSNDFKLENVKDINIDYIDREKLKNKIKLTKKNNNYFISGKSFNLNRIIDKLLNSKDNKQIQFFNKDLKIIVDIEKVYLDKKNIINQLNGFLSFNKNKISELNLESKFSNQENIKFTIKNNGQEKITTLYSHQAKPFVDRYEFIKGFEGKS